MANCHPHSMCWYLWDLFEGLMWPLGKWTSVDCQLSPPLHPWKENLPWFASSYLCPPPGLLTLSPDMFASAWLLSSPCSPQDCLVCLSHLCPPPCLLTLSPDMFASAWLLSSPHSPQDHLVCLSHLCLPPCLLTLSPDMFASAWLLSSPCSPQDRLVCFFPSAPATSFAHPPHTGFFYMAGWMGGRFMDGLGAH